MHTPGVFQVYVNVGGRLSKVDGVAFEGKLWLVPFWRDSANKQATMPGLMVRFDTLQYSEFGRQYLVSEPLPQAVFDGVATEGFEILRAPQITLHIQRVETH